MWDAVKVEKIIEKSIFYFLFFIFFGKGGGGSQKTNKGGVTSTLG